MNGNQVGEVKAAKIFCRFQCPKDPTDVTPENFERFWSKPDAWKSGKLPLAGEDVVIEPGWKMIYDLPESPIFNTISI